MNDKTHSTTTAQKTACNAVCSELLRTQNNGSPQTASCPAPRDVVKKRWTRLGVPLDVEVRSYPPVWKDLLSSGDFPGHA